MLKLDSFFSSVSFASVIDVSFSESTVRRRRLPARR